MRFLARITRPTREVIEAAIAQSGLDVVEAALVAAVQPLIPPLPTGEPSLSNPVHAPDEA